jgi:hypothetical protein
MAIGVRLSLILLVAGVLAGCQSAGDEAVVARVGGRVLTLQRVRQEVPTDLPDSLKASAREAFVNQWVEEELLLLEAHNRKIEEDSWVERALDTYRRKVMISRLLDIESIVDSVVGDSLVAAYYQSHRSEFALPEDAVLMAYLVSSDKDEAHRARLEWAEGTAISELLPGEMNLWGEDSIVVTKDELESLGDMIFRMRDGSLSDVQPLGDHWAIFKMYRHYEAGSIKDLPDAASEIRARLLAISRKQAQDRFLERLRSKYPVEVNDDLLSNGLRQTQGVNN